MTRKTDNPLDKIDREETEAEIITQARETVEAFQGTIIEEKVELLTEEKMTDPTTDQGMIDLLTGTDVLPVEGEKTLVEGEKIIIDAETDPETVETEDPGKPNMV